MTSPLAPLPRLHGIVPPLPTPFHADGPEEVDLETYGRLIDFQVRAGVHGLWVLGTTARFDLVPDDDQRRIAETAVEAAAGRVPMVLNVSDQGTRRTLTRARMFDDLSYDYYAALPPWYQPMTPDEVMDYFRALADGLSKPLIIYNAPWINNQLTFDRLRALAEHPRIVGCKDVTPSLVRGLDWPIEERRALDFSYLHGTDLLGTSTDLGADGFVSSLSNALPEMAVALWDAARAGDAEQAFRLQSRFCRIARATGFGPMLACLEVLLRRRGLVRKMLPAPLKPVDAATARRIIAVLDAEGALPQAPAETIAAR